MLVAEVRKWGLGKGKNKCGRKEEMDAREGGNAGRSREKGENGCERKEEMPAGQLRKGEMDAKEREWTQEEEKMEMEEGGDGLGRRGKWKWET